mgnify:CR=1 FL=1
MRFGIFTLDDWDVSGRTVLCRVDINQPVDRAAGALRSTKRIEACVPTVRELADKGARVVLLAHQGSDIEYQNYWSTEPHAAVLRRLLGREVKWIDDVCGPAARAAIQALRDGPGSSGRGWSAGWRAPTWSPGTSSCWTTCASWQRSRRCSKRA